MFLPGESQWWRSLMGCCLWGRTELDMTEGTAAATGSIVSYRYWPMRLQRPRSLMMRWSHQAEEPGKLGYNSVQVWRLENQSISLSPGLSPKAYCQRGGEDGCLSSSREEKIASPFTFLFYLSHQWIRCLSSALVSVIFTQSADSSANLFWRYFHRHIQKCLIAIQAFFSPIKLTH